MANLSYTVVTSSSLTAPSSLTSSSDYFTINRTINHTINRTINRTITNN